MTEAGHQLQKLTECSICLKEFTDPRMLACIHTFCLECLRQTADATKKKPGENLPCPLCRKMFPIPADGLDRLQKNFFMQRLLEVTTTLQLSNMSGIACDICKVLYEGDEKTKTATMQCLECRDNFCEFCAKAHKLQKLSKDHHVVKIGSETEEDIRRISPSRNCADHNRKPLDYYCPQCKKIVCVSCVIENHGSHNCKDVSTVDNEFRQAIDTTAIKVASYVDEMLSKRKSFELRKHNILLKVAETESEIQQRNVELKEMIDRQTGLLLEELSRTKQKQIKDCENEKEEIERSHTILKSFETYCIELRLKGSASDICSCVDELLNRANELEKDHEAFIGRPCQSTEISFKPTVLEELPITPGINIVGQIQEDISHFMNYMVIAGLNDDSMITQEVTKINLHRTNDISTEQQIPTTMQREAIAAVYCNTMYVAGIGVNANEIWKYSMTSGWMKCASLVQGRRRHSAAFIDEVLYICGGIGLSEKRILDSVEAYNAVTNNCSIAGKLVHCVESSGNCVPYKSSLYIFGGSDKDDNDVGHVQVYNTVQNTCTLHSKPMPLPNNMMRAVLWETSVILVGCDTCFIFNFETENWQERKQFKADVGHFGLVLENERIFVIGGGGVNEKDQDGKSIWKCRNDVRYVPIRIVMEDKPVEWKIHAALPRPSKIQAYEKNNFLCLLEQSQQNFKHNNSYSEFFCSLHFSLIEMHAGAKE